MWTKSEPIGKCDLILNIPAGVAVLPKDIVVDVTGQMKNAGITLETVVTAEVVPDKVYVTGSKLHIEGIKVFTNGGNTIKVKKFKAEIDGVKEYEFIGQTFVYYKVS
jgi:hypothetical protein